MDERELEQMVEEAKKAAREYSAKAQPGQEGEGTQAPEAETADPVQSASADKSSSGKGGRDGLLSALLKDKDRTIILSLMLLLMDENGDHSLMLALLYLLM